MRANDFKARGRAPWGRAALTLAVVIWAALAAWGCARPSGDCGPMGATCDGACVNTASDPDNCGACGNSCRAGETCSGGECTFTCIDGAASCGDKCVRLADDPDNCGACGVACGPGEGCASGACVAGCDNGGIHCGAACVITASDPQNCGGCGNVCPGGHVCSQGVCSTSCDPGLMQCDASCVDVYSDPQNCGGCFYSCPSGYSCSGGACQCSAGKQDCGFGCVDVKSDPQNCGGCFNSCGSGEACVGGACQCAGGMAMCGGSCKDLQNDPTSCGACNKACGPGLACQNGTCACPNGTVTCNGACTDLDVSVSNCGACGVACAAGEVCSAGVCDKPTGEWQMLGGDAQHSGHNTQETGKPPLSLAFATQVGGGGALSPAAVSGGRVIVTTSGSVQALSITDGASLWTYNIAGFSVGHPSAVGDRVYVQSCNHTPGTYLWVFDAATGTPTIAAPFSAQWENYWSPLVVDDTVYIDGGYYGGLYAFDGPSGAEVFFSGSLEQYDEWSPAYFNGSVYTFVEGNLRAHDPMTGDVQWTTSVMWDWAGWSMQTAPVFGSQYAYVIAPPNLHAIDPVSHTIAWSANGAYKGVPAVADGAVYAVSGGSLIVRDAMTGSLLWTFVGDATLMYPPVIAAGYVYVASNNNVYAVDIASHAQAWTTSKGGWLAIASGRLFVSRSDGTLAGYALSP